MSSVRTANLLAFVLAASSAFGLYWLSSLVLQARNATLHFGADAHVSGAYIGPFTAIGNGVELKDTEIEHSIVLEGAKITDLGTRIEDSLIGRNVRIFRLPVRPSAYRFMLGDNSEVGIRW